MMSLTTILKHIQNILEAEL